jgi:stage V sporulation protein SpoVS
MLELYGGNVSGGDINMYVANAVKALAVQYSTGNTVSEYGFRQKAGSSSNYSAVQGLFISDSLGNNGNTAGATGVAIKACAVPANTLSENGQKLHVKAFGSFSSSGSTNKRLRLRWAGVDIWDSGGLTIVSVQWWIEATIIRSSSSNAACFLRYINSAGTVVVTSANITTTFSNSNNLQVLGGGTLADDVTAYMLTADYVPLSPN